MAEEIIGKVSATEKNPSTINEFYFWTKAGYKLSPFDVIKVEHIDDSVTFGVIEEICHVTDSASHFASYISSDFGDVTPQSEGNTDRLAFNYVKARVVGNTGNIYTPVLHGRHVRLCSVDDIQKALGLKNVKNPLTCGYLEMYGERVPVELNADFLVGPDGAHLNISGISGLACKTSYTMFLLNALQQKYAKNVEEDNDDAQTISFVLFNVKGRDLLSIDRKGKVSQEDEEIYQMLNMEAKPFSNVHYYYPYSDNEVHAKTYADKHYLMEQFDHYENASKYKYTYKFSKEKLEFLFANEEDSTGTLASILTYINNDGAPFEGCETWNTFKGDIQKVLNNPDSPARKNSGIQLSSWKKFNRILEKALNDKVFIDALEPSLKEVDLGESIKKIQPNEIKVVDIAKLDDKTQSFVFGDVMETIMDLMNSKEGDNVPDKIVVFVDELNKYASQDTPKSSPILKQLLEVAERGRSLGLILFSVEQFRSAIHDRVKGNCATSAYGRTNFVEVGKSDYRYLGDTYRTMMTRLAPGEYIISNPALRSLINIKFPRPTYKESK